VFFNIYIYIYTHNIYVSRWPYVLKCRSVAAQKVRSRVPTPLKARMFVSYVFLTVSKGLCDGPITRPGKSYRVNVSYCVVECNNRPLSLKWVR
jgi:hypothetical protein